MLKVYDSFDALPREDKYMFSRLYVNPEIGRWYAVELHGCEKLRKLAYAMGESYPDICTEDDDDTYFYLIIR